MPGTGVFGLSVALQLWKPGEFNKPKRLLTLSYEHFRRILNEDRLKKEWERLLMRLVYTKKNQELILRNTTWSLRELAYYDY